MSLRGRPLVRRFLRHTDGHNRGVIALVHTPDGLDTETLETIIGATIYPASDAANYTTGAIPTIGDGFIAAMFEG